jgi:hypothetical protein
MSQSSEEEEEYDARWESEWMTLTSGNETIRVSAGCQESMPCLHTVFVNDVEYEWNGVAVARWCKKNGVAAPGHIKKYLDSYYERYTSFMKIVKK